MIEESKTASVSILKTSFTEINGYLSSGIQSRQLPGRPKIIINKKLMIFLKTNSTVSIEINGGVQKAPLFLVNGGIHANMNFHLTRN